MALSIQIPRAFQIPIAAAVLIAATLTAGGAPANKPAAQQIYKVDSVIATNKGKTIVVQSKGAVQTGGWTQAKLRVLHNDGHVLTMELVAVPPPPDMTVINALVPIKADAKIRTPHAAAIVSVRVQASANEVTAQVLH